MYTSLSLSLYLSISYIYIYIYYTINNNIIIIIIIIVGERTKPTRGGGSISDGQEGLLNIAECYILRRDVDC